jgi:hypothetical protein
MESAKAMQTDERNPKENEFYSSITDYVVELRKHHVRKTQAEWAEMLGITVTGLASIERYNSFLRTHHLLYIARAIKKTSFYSPFVKFINKHILDYDIDINPSMRPVTQVEKELRSDVEDLSLQLRITKRRLEISEQLNASLKEENEMLQKGR